MFKVVVTLRPISGPGHPLPGSTKVKTLSFPYKTRTSPGASTFADAERLALNYYTQYWKPKGLGMTINKIVRVGKNGGRFMYRSNRDRLRRM